VRADGILSILVVAFISTILMPSAFVGLLVAVSSVTGPSRICAVTLAQLDRCDTGRQRPRLRSTSHEFVLYLLGCHGTPCTCGSRFRLAQAQLFTCPLIALDE